MEGDGDAGPAVDNPLFPSDMEMTLEPEVLEAIREVSVPSALGASGHAHTGGGACGAGDTRAIP